MASRAHKKSKMNQVKGEDQHREQNEDELFTLEYLHNTISYLMPNTSSGHISLEVDPTALEVLQQLFESIIFKDPSQLGIHFIEKLKLMKQKCEDDTFVKDYQEHGDFINYDIPKENSQHVRSLEAQLKEEHQKVMAIKRIRLKFPQAPLQMALHELQKWQNKIKKDTLDSLLRNFQRIPEQPDKNLQNNPLYRELFNITSINSRPDIKYDINGRSTNSINNDTIPSHKKKSSGDHKKEVQGNKQQKSKKISKPSKKTDSRMDQQQEYFPKVGKKGGKTEEGLSAPTEKKQVLADSLVTDNGQYLMLRRSNQAVEEKIDQENGQLKNEEVHQEPKQVKEQGAVNPSPSSAQNKAKPKSKKVKKEQKTTTQKLQKQEKKKLVKEQKVKIHNSKQAKELLKQKIETAMIAEPQEPENKLVPANKDSELKKEIFQVSIGIQADVESLQKEIYKEQNLMPVIQQDTDKILEKNVLQEKQQVQIIVDLPKQTNGDKGISKCQEVDQDQIIQMNPDLRNNEQQLSPSGAKMVPEINPQPVNIEGFSNSNFQEDPDISDLLKLD